MNKSKRKFLQNFVLQFVFSSSFSVTNISTRLTPPALIASQNETLMCSEIYVDEPQPDLGKYAENKSYYDRFLVMSEETGLAKFQLNETNKFKKSQNLLGSKKLNEAIYRIDLNLNSQGNFLPVVFKDPFQTNIFKGRVTPSRIYFGKTGYFELSAPF
jgi:hypothetical protein